MAVGSGMTTEIREILGPYEGKRLARTSNNVVNVRVSRRYFYRGYVIVVNSIYAQMDRETGRIYIPGPLALEINREVEGVMASIRAKESGAYESAPSLLTHIPLVIEIHAPDRRAA